MRTKQLLNSLPEHELKYVYSPVDNNDVLDLDGVTVLKSISPVDFNSKFRVSDFKLQIMLDSGVDPKVLQNAGYKILPINSLEFFDELENVNLPVEPKN